jgi:hypothetical protein
MGRIVMRPLTAAEETQRIWETGEPISEIAEHIIKSNDRLES